MKNHYDLLVIGAGSGGLAAAKKAAESGASVAIVEMSQIGGTCVNRGCVPKKICWYAAEVGSYFSFYKEYGYKDKPPTFTFKKFVQDRQRYLKSLQKKYFQRVKKDKITYLLGQAKFISPHTVKIQNKIYSAKHIIIAAGCAPNVPNIEGAQYAIDSDGFFALKKLPKKMVIVGGGFIAMELSSIINKLDVDVSLILRAPKPLKNFDSMISTAMLDFFKFKNIKIYKKNEIIKITRDAHKKLTLHCKNNQKIMRVDSVLFAIGRHPCLDSLNLAAAGVKLNKNKFIATDKWEATNVPHIYAIGDVAGKKQQTPVAIAAGRKLAARLFGGDKKAFVDYNNIPTVVFTHPPIGTVGLTEAEAVKKYGRNNLAIYENRFISLFYALSKEKFFSYVKLITLKKSSKIIGLHLIDKHADEILQGFAVALKMGMKKNDLDNSIGIHPTSAEEILALKNTKHQRASKN